MPEPQKCARCGAQLSAEAPGGHCPRCILQLALIEDDDPLPVGQPAPGDHIGRYKLLQKIGEGGCGVVYMAGQEEPIKRLVALKIIKPGMDTRDVLGRFEAERQALALMDHPNIAKVLDAGATKTGRPFFAMELVRGIPITRYCDKNQLKTEQRLELFVQVCRAIQHAHQKGIIHRDIKPSNVLVADHDGVPVPKIIDFGIAKATTGQSLTDKTVFTALEQFIGTPAYMSPEQARLSGLDIDTRSDIYSLGVLLYELLTGKTPFDAKRLFHAGFDEIRRIIREEEPPRPSHKLSTLASGEQTTTARARQTDTPRLIHLVRGDLDWIVMKCLEKDRNRRYETANGLASDITHHLHQEPVSARPPSRIYRLQKMIRRNRVAFAAGGTVLAALVFGLGLSTWLFLRERAARQRANSAEATARMEAAKSVQVAQFLKDMVTGVGPAVAQGQDTTLLRGILDKTSARIDKDLKNQPEVATDLKATLGNVYGALGEYDKADKTLRDAIALRNEQEGGDANTAALLNNLGIVLARKGKWTEAETMHRRALLIQQNVPNPDAGQMAKTLVDLGNALWFQGRLAEAEPVYRKALALARQVGGGETELMATTVGSLGMLLATQGKPSEAEPLFRQALQTQRKLFGANHPQVARSLSNLGNCLSDQGKLAEAETMYRESVDIRRRILGNEHPDLAFSLNNLGDLLSREGKFAQAETAHREALEIRRKSFGNNHADVALSLNQLANALRAQGKLGEAEPLYREALAIRRKLLGNLHPEVVQSLNDLGMALNQEGKHAEAEINLREAVTLQRKLSGKPNATLATLLRNLAFVLDRQGKLDEQEHLLREVLAVRKKVLAENDPAVAGSLTDLADVLEQRDKLAEAETVCREALALREKFTPDNWEAFDTRSQLGGILVGRTNYVAAASLLLSGYEGMSQRKASIPISNKYQLIAALQRIVRLYDATGQSAQAAKWKKKLEAAQ